MPKYFRDPECLSVYYDQHLRSFNDVDVVVLDRADWARLVVAVSDIIQFANGDCDGRKALLACDNAEAIIEKVEEANSHE